MDAYDTLAEQVGAFGEVVGRNVADFSRHRLRDDESMFMRLSASDRDGALRRMSHFLVPYVEAAKSRGEVREDVDPDEARGVARSDVDVGDRHAVVVGVRRPPSQVGRPVHGHVRRGRAPRRAVSDTHVDDLEAVKIVMARYFRFMDTKQWSDLRELFADDMTMFAPDDVADAPGPRRWGPCRAHDRAGPRSVP